MAKNAFDSFRKRLENKRDDEPPPEEPASAEPASEEDEEVEPEGADDGGSPLERMRAARARLAALKGKGAEKGSTSTERSRGSSLSERAKTLSGTKRAAAPKPKPARKARRTPPAGSPTGDDFESYRRSQESVAQDDAKKRAFDEGVEVQELDRSRMAEDRATRIEAEKLGVEKRESIITARFSKEDLDKMESAPLEVSDERPEAFDDGRVTRLSAEEIAAAGDEVAPPEGFRSHRVKKKSAQEMEGEVERPEGFSSHRHRKPRKSDDDPKAVEGFKRFEF